VTNSPALRGILAASALLVVAVGVWLATRAAPTVGSTQAVAQAQPAIPAPRSMTAGTIETGQRPAQVPPSSDFAMLFRNAGNYRQFIIASLPAAKDGNAEAQYYLSAALRYCDETYRFYFKRKGKVLSLDEAIAVQTNRASFQYIDALKLAETRCREVNGHVDPAWGGADEWVARAAQAGQPVALLEKATRIFLESDMKVESPLRKADGESYSLDEARAMVRTAARSGNPAVLFALGELSLLMRPDQPEPEQQVESMAWRYAACLRGFDCSAEAEWHRAYCTVDPDCRAAEPGMEYLRRMAAQREMYDLELRASVINERINGGDWAALGLDE
jgi:hypothetical protein